MKFLERRTSKLSLAILPKDAFSPDEALKGNIVVSVNDRPYRPITNRMGYYLFRDLPEGEYDVSFRGDYYNDKELSDISGLNPLSPVVEFDVHPNPYYPFPEGTTLLKGIVTDTEGRAVPDAEVSIHKDNRTATTDDNGKFIFYFKDVEDDEFNIKLNIKKTGYKDEKPHISIFKGKTSLVHVNILPK